MTAWYILYVWAAAAVAMFIGWLIQRRTRNAGIVDAIWSACMGAAALFYAGVGGGGLVARLAVAMLGGLWGFRLCMHILSRVLNEPEDGRYRYLREYWRDDQRKFFGFFQAQAVLTVLFSLPFYAVAENPRESMSIWCACGLTIWIISVTGESIADAQLSRFRKNPKNHGKTCRTGLWRYSRHPNYFFEWLHWFTYVFLAIGTPFPAWLLSLLGPTLMLASLCWISGIPFTEAQALRSRGNDYRQYQRTTSMLIPWFPKKDRAEG
jgi:steroid 5-alpha reductase family enzyme